jgi:hypothetical protein
MQMSEKHVDEALDRMKAALKILDAIEDPCLATPHLDLAIARVEEWRGERKSEPDHGTLQ